MKEFRGRDVVPGCSATLRFPTEEEVLVAVANHARADHKMVDIPPALIDAVKRHIVTVA